MIISRYLKIRFVLARATLYLKYKRFDYATVILEQALRKLDNDPDLLRYLSHAYHMSRKWDREIYALERLVKSYPDSLGYRWALGVRHLQLGNYETAMRILEHCAKASPDNEILLSALGIVYLYSEIYEKSDEFFLRVEDIAPWNPDVCVHLYLLYLATSRFDLIEEKLLNYIGEYPNLYPVYLSMGDHIQYRLNNPVESLGWYKKGVSLLKDSKANKYLEKYELLTGLNYQLLDNYCEALIKSGETDLAWKSINRSLSEDRNNPVSISRLINYYLETGEYSKAEREARRVCETDPVWTGYLPLLSAALLKQNLVEEALETARESVKQEKENLDAWTALGNAEKQIKNWQGAIDAYNVFIKRSPFAPDILGDLSYCYQQLGRFEEALICAKKRTIFDPKFPDAWFDLESLYLNTGNNIEAEYAHKKGMESKR